MQLIEFLDFDARASLKHLGLMAFVAGATSAGMLVIVNAVAQMPANASGHLYYIAAFGLALIAYMSSQRYVLVKTGDEVERVVDQRRRGLIHKLAKCELRGVEKIGHGMIFTAINSDTQTISQAAGALILGVQAVMMIFWAAVYIAALSPPALALVVVILLIAARVYRQRIERAGHELRRAHDQVTALHEMVDGLLGGFKEVKLSSRRAAELLQDAMAVSERTAFFRSLAQRALGANFVFSQVAIFVLLGALVFVLPALSSTFAGITVKALTAVLFLVGPISGIISAAPQITIANAAAENMLHLEHLLDAHIEAGDRPKGADASRAPDAGFKEIELHQLLFSRGEGSERFTVGPIDLRIRRGETLFITGGNGSGKTTFIKMLTGLYPADSGHILVDGHIVDRFAMQGYRDLFGAVFSDFHLFGKLYGIDSPDPARAAAMIGEMEIEDKVRLDFRRFSTVDLSTGQRKRLALVATQLEDRPIIVLDEWAADQDPHFRAKFYEILLPRLRAAGVTVIAITHDDKYFHHADRRLHIEDGRIADISNRKVLACGEN